MCKIYRTYHTCGHRIEHTWSACRGMIKNPDSSVPACLKYASFSTHASHKCGNCYRKDEEDKVYHELGFTRDQELADDQQATLNERLTEATHNIPTTNWRPVPPPVYGRRPSGSRSVTLRKSSLLSRVVKPEDVVGPDAWESVPVSDGPVPVYQTVWGGWDFVWTPETKSLVEEITEDAAKRGEEVQSDQDEFDQDESYQDWGDQDGPNQDEIEGDEIEGDEIEGDEEGDDLLLLAQQTPLPLDPEVDNMYDDHYSERESSLPTMALDAPMPIQDDILTNTTLETTPTTQHPPALGNGHQPAESTIEDNDTTTSQPSRPTRPHGPSYQLTGDSNLIYWYRQTRRGLFECRNEVGCWELVSAA